MKSLHLIFGAVQQACPYLELCFGWDDGGRREGGRDQVRGPSHSSQGKASLCVPEATLSNYSTLLHFHSPLRELTYSRKHTVVKLEHVPVFFEQDIVVIVQDMQTSFKRFARDRHTLRILNNLLGAFTLLPPTFHSALLFTVHGSAFHFGCPYKLIAKSLRTLWALTSC